MATRKISNVIDLHKNVEALCVKALGDTLEELKEELHNIIVKDVYSKRKGLFYKRSRVLLPPNVIKLRIWNAFSASKVGGTLKFDEDYFDASVDVDNYIHGNPYFGELTMNSYLEILNNQADYYKYEDSPYLYLGFHRVERKPFWDDFLDWIDSQGGFEAIYKRHLDEYVIFSSYTGKYLRRNI